MPVERRPWVPVESVARTLDPGRTLPVDLAGDEVIRAVQAHPAPSYLVVSGDDVVGVLRTADLAGCCRPDPTRTEPRRTR